jgi:hypothetical protein
MKDQITETCYDFCVDEDLHEPGETDDENDSSHKGTGTGSSFTMSSLTQSSNFYEPSPNKPKYKHIPLDVKMKI